MQATKLSKRGQFTLEKAVGFFLLTELTFFLELSVIKFDLDVLTLLALSGEVELPVFCATAARKFHPNCAPEQLATREQNVRNRLVKLEKRGLVTKRRPGVKTLVTLASHLAIPTHTSVVLDYQLLGRASD